MLNGTLREPAGTAPTPVLCRVAKSTLAWPRPARGHHEGTIMNLTCRSLFQTDACMHLVILAYLVRAVGLWLSPRIGPAGAP